MKGNEFFFRVYMDEISFGRLVSLFFNWIKLAEVKVRVRGI